MSAWSRVLPLCVGLALLAGCGDQGCDNGAKPQTAPESDGGNGRPNTSDKREGVIQFADAKGNLPEQYRRPNLLRAAHAADSRPTAEFRIVRRGVDGVADRVEAVCPVDAAPAECLTRPEIKSKCCAEGILERCTAGLSGLHVIGRRCGPPPQPAP